MSETDLAIQVPDLYEERGWHANLVYPDGTLHCETCHEAHLDDNGKPVEDGCWPCAYLKLWDCAETLAAEVARLAERLIIAEACANGRAMDALETLMKMTGSFNSQNPWLGITAAVALLQIDASKAALRAANPQAAPHE